MIDIDLVDAITAAMELVSEKQHREADQTADHGSVSEARRAMYRLAGGTEVRQAVIQSIIEVSTQRTKEVENGFHRM